MNAPWDSGLPKPERTFLVVPYTLPTTGIESTRSSRPCRIRCSGPEEKRMPASITTASVMTNPIPGMGRPRILRASGAARLST